MPRCQMISTENWEMHLCVNSGKTIVDGSEIRKTHQLRLVVEIPLFFSVYFYSPRCGQLDFFPSTSPIFLSNTWLFSPPPEVAPAAYGVKSLLNGIFASEKKPWRMGWDFPTPRTPKLRGVVELPGTFGCFFFVVLKFRSIFQFLTKQDKSLSSFVHLERMFWLVLLPW